MNLVTPWLVYLSPRLRAHSDYFAIVTRYRDAKLWQATVPYSLKAFESEQIKKQLFLTIIN